jgi:hypothetical protein
MNKIAFLYSKLLSFNASSACSNDFSKLCKLIYTYKCQQNLMLILNAMLQLILNY